jgi:hypothetical protein
MAIVFKLYEHARLLLDNGVDPCRESGEFDRPNTLDIARETNMQ